MALSMPATLEARSSAPQIAQSPMVLLGSWGSSNHSGFKIRFFPFRKEARNLEADRDVGAVFS